MKKIFTIILFLFTYVFLIGQNSPPQISIMSIKSTHNVTYITGISAASGGIIVSSNEKLNTARGVCWSTNITPTITDKYTSNGTGDGSFTSVMTGLYPNTTYYVRSYATYAVNSSSVVHYGPEISFTTIGEYTQFGCLFAVVETNTPNIIEIIYNYDLSYSAITAKGFSVVVNNENVVINRVEIEGNKIKLILFRNIFLEDFVAVSYTATLDNPIKTYNGYTLQSTSYQLVFNNIFHNIN
jgi:hypothetical protein